MGSTNNAVLVELDELSSGVPSFLKSDNGKLLRIAIFYLVTWLSNVHCPAVAGPVLFSNLFGLNAVLVELDKLSSEVPSLLKYDNGKLFRIAILYLVMWVSRVNCPAIARRVQCTQSLVVTPT